MQAEPVATVPADSHHIPWGFPRTMWTDRCCFIL
jgi:hypothetical protein